MWVSFSRNHATGNGESARGQYQRHISIWLFRFSPTTKTWHRSTSKWLTGIDSNRRFPTRHIRPSPPPDLRPSKRPRLSPSPAIAQRFEQPPYPPCDEWPCLAYTFLNRPLALRRSVCARIRPLAPGAHWLWAVEKRRMRCNTRPAIDVGI